jgi:hypothetical protein
MIEYVGRIDDFWTEAIESYVFPHNVSTGQNELFHANYSDSKNDLLQGFDNELPAIYTQFYTALGVESGAVSWTCVRPSNTIPVHQDKFFKLRSKHNVDISNCVRYLIFLQDWTLGHIAEFEDFALPRWKKGDIWKFDHTARHYAANASNENFITCQINVIER